MFNEFVNSRRIATYQISLLQGENGPHLQAASLIFCH